MSTAPPTSHWQSRTLATFRGKGNINKVSDYFIFCIFSAFLNFHFGHFQKRFLSMQGFFYLLYTKTGVTLQFKQIKQQQLLTLTAKILLFLQLEVATLTGVAWLSPCVGLAVTLPTFLDKTHETISESGNQSSTHSLRWIRVCTQMCITNKGEGEHNNGILTCWQSPTPLRVPFTSHWHSGRR